MSPTAQKTGSFIRTIDVVVEACAWRKRKRGLEREEETWRDVKFVSGCIWRAGTLDLSEENTQKKPGKVVDICDESIIRGLVERVKKKDIFR